MIEDRIREGLERAGYVFGDAEDFLGLSPEERILVQTVIDCTRLAWTAEPPKAPGWYWLRGDGIPPSTMHWFSQWHVEHPEAFQGKRFAGPIPEPVEPEGDE